MNNKPWDIISLLIFFTSVAIVLCIVIFVRTHRLKEPESYYHDQVVLQNIQGDTLKVYNNVHFEYIEETAVLLKTEDRERIYVQGGIITIRLK